MAVCDRCKKEIPLNWFPKLKFQLKGAVMFSHNPYNYIDVDYTLCDKCKKEFDLFMRQGEKK